MDISYKELTVVKRKIGVVAAQAEAITIKSSEDYDKAIDTLAKVKEVGETITAEKEKITKPLNQALKQTRELFAPLEAMWSEAERIIKTKILGYKREQDEIARKKEQAIAEKVEAGKISFESGAKKMLDIKKVETTTQSNKGFVQVRKIKKFEITDAEKLPRKYLLPNTVLIRQDAVINGIEIPGVRVYEEETIASGSI